MKIEISEIDSVMDLKLLIEKNQELKLLINIKHM